MTATTMKQQDSSKYPALSSGKLHRFLKRVNWPLLLGGVIVLLLVLVAVLGPEWAPKDPMEENYTLKIDGRITRPPYPPFENPGYPLGTDGFGRDILSRLLWGVRPTLVLVTTVAAVRLVLGIILGLLVGWSSGLRGRMLDGILSVALSIPVLIVALIGIAAVGIDRGMWAFIVGLALTGWAETARLVGEQTRSIKNQAYVEAAQAMGASDFRILVNHVLRQIMPLVWMLLAFEVSATLLVVAELGFLGYYIGGGVWVEIFDFTVVNTTGLPELGQMLATALIKLTDPSALIAIGSVLFLAILGFNLVGEGLRRRLDPERLTARRPIFGFTGRMGDWIEERVTRPVGGWVEDHALQVGLAGLVVLFVGGWSLWWGSRPARKPVHAQSVITVPGGHLWASEQHDAQGTRWVAGLGPENPNILWEFLVPGGPVGGPVVAKDGTIFIAGRENVLIALDPSRTIKWRAPLPEEPVGTPALGPSGEIYVVGVSGGLTMVNPDGTQGWSFVPNGGREATSGPILASDGTIYFTRVDSVQAVSTAGEGLFTAYALDNYYEGPPIISAGESYLFLKNAALAANSGVLLDLKGLPLNDATNFTDTAFFVGANRQTYLRLGHEVIGWRATEAGVEMDPGSTWDYQGSVLFFPKEAGVTPEELIWLLYIADFSDTRLVWLDKNSKLLANTRLPGRQGLMIGVDQNSVIYLCNSDFGVNPTCFAVELGSERPKWELKLDAGFEITGGALVPGRLYIASGAGFLYAIGEAQPSNE